MPDEFGGLIRDYIRCENRLFLDVAQLIKHSIGLIRKSLSESVRPMLVYIYWQPSNWYCYKVYRKHAEEINKFYEEIKHFIQFIPLSYLELWKLYEYDPLFGEHISKVKERYFISI